MLPKRLQEAIWELQDSLKGGVVTPTRQQPSGPTLRGDSPLHAGRISLDPGTLVCADLRCAQRISILKFLRLDFETRFFELLSSTCGPSDSPRASQERPRQPQNAPKTSQRCTKEVLRRLKDKTIQDPTRPPVFSWRQRSFSQFSHVCRPELRNAPYA